MNTKELAKRTIADKTLKDGAYQIAVNPKYDKYQAGLQSMVNKFLDMKRGSAATSKVAADVTEVLAQEVHKTVIKNFKRRKVHPWHKDNTWSIEIIFGSTVGYITMLVLFILIFLYLWKRYNRLIQEVKDKVVPPK